MVEKTLAEKMGVEDIVVEKNSGATFVAVMCILLFGNAAFETGGSEESEVKRSLVEMGSDLSEGKKKMNFRIVRQLRGESHIRIK